MGKKILKVILIEDNLLLSENIGTYLGMKAIELEAFESVEEAEKRVEEGDFDVLVLDINLPGKSGIDYLKELRSNGNTSAIIMLTSHNTSDDIVNGLDSGADDYVSKPFNFEEFVARIKSLSKRGKKLSSKEIILKIKEEGKENILEINLEYKKVKRNGENIYLPALEYKLFIYLLKNRGKIISRDILYEEVWGEFDKYQLSRTVDVYIGYLRKKLGKKCINTKKGDGYFIE